MTALTIKDLPRELHRRLRARAARNGRSLNNEILSCLKSAVSSELVDADQLLAVARCLRAEARGRVAQHELLGKRDPRSR